MEFTYKQAEYHALFYRESGRVRFLKIILKLPLLMDNFMCVYSICTMSTVYVQYLQYITVCIVYVWCVYSSVFTVLHYVYSVYACTVCIRIWRPEVNLGCCSLQY